MKIMGKESLVFVLFCTKFEQFCLRTVCLLFRFTVVRSDAEQFGPVIVAKQFWGLFFTCHLACVVVWFIGIKNYSHSLFNYVYLSKINQFSLTLNPLANEQRSESIST